MDYFSWCVAWFRKNIITDNIKPNFRTIPTHHPFRFGCHSDFASILSLNLMLKLFITVTFIFFTIIIVVVVVILFSTSDWRMDPFSEFMWIIGCISIQITKKKKYHPMAHISSGGSHRCGSILIWLDCNLIFISYTKLNQRWSILLFYVMSR